MGVNSEQYIAVFENQVKLEFSNLVNLVNSVNKRGTPFGRAIQVSAKSLRERMFDWPRGTDDGSSSFCRLN